MVGGAQHECDSINSLSKSWVMGVLLVTFPLVYHIDSLSMIIFMESLSYVSQDSVQRKGLLT